MVSFKSQIYLEENMSLNWENNKTGKQKVSHNTYAISIKTFCDSIFVSHRIDDLRSFLKRVCTLQPFLQLDERGMTERRFNNQSDV